MKNEKLSPRYSLIFVSLVLLLICSVLVSCGGGGGSESSVSSSGDSSGDYNVSGTINVYNSVAFDSDTNDPEADYTANDTSATAQSVTIPVTVGGYVNVGGAGESGRSYSDGDPADFYEVTVTAKQVVALSFSDSRSANLDLFVYDNDGDLMYSSQGTGVSETIQINDAGNYYIKVQASSGAANYTLTIGQMIYSPGAEELHLSDDFISGEVIVNYKAQGTGSIGAMISASDVGLSVEGGEPGRAMRLGFSSNSQRERAFNRLGVSRPSAALIPTNADTGTQNRLDTVTLVQALRQRDDVVSADLNYYRYRTKVPDDPYYSAYQSWNYELISLPDAWNYTTGSDDVVVAVVDTGVLLEHPDLTDRLVDGYDFVLDSEAANDGDGIDDDPDDPGDSTSGDSSFHGTHVAGIIAAATDNSVGVAGVAWNGKIMPVRALGIDGGTSYDIMQAVRYAAGLDNDSGDVPDTLADIINLSLGGTGYSESEQELYTEVQSAGIIVIAAAGNNGSSIRSYPAAYDGVFSVSAVGADSLLASYSSYGSTVDIAAPGGSDSDYVYSTLGDDSSGVIGLTYGGMMGTSMAAPHVSGVAALLKSLYPDLTSYDFDALLRNDLITRDLGDTGRDNDYGYGLIDAYMAVDWAQNDGVVPTTLIADPESLTFGSSSETLTIEVSISGTDDSGGISVNSDQDWLTLSGTDVDSAGIGEYSASVDRDSLSAGSYSGTLTFTSSNGDIADLEVPVTMQVSADSVSVNGGFHHVQLCDSQSGDVLYETSGYFEDGQFDYSFTGVAAGNYLLYGGTDVNNDGSIQDEGESVGAYPSLRQTTSFSVSGDLSGLDFETQFSVRQSPFVPLE